MPPTADLSDAHDGLQYAEPMLVNFGGRARFSGTLATVKVYEDNVLYEEALRTVAPGSVVVVDGGGSLRCALMGDRLGQLAVDRKLPGVIIHGCVRDTAQLADLDVAVLALAPHPRKSAKQGAGERDVPVTFAGVIWTPGEWVCGDEDGVVISPDPLPTQAGR